MLLHSTSFPTQYITSGCNSNYYYWLLEIKKHVQAVFLKTNKLVKRWHGNTDTQHGDHTNARTCPWQCTCNVTLRCVHTCSAKAISITYCVRVCVCVCVCVCSLSQHAMRMRRIVICGLSDYTGFFHISHKMHDFRIRVIQHKMCVLIFSTALVRNISPSTKKWERYDQKCTLVTMSRTRYFFVTF